MTNKQLKKKIEEIVTKTPLGIEEFGCPCENCAGTRKKIVKKLLSLCKEYALSCLPKKKKVKFNTDLGFNQAIKKSKEAIEGK